MTRFIDRQTLGQYHLKTQLAKCRLRENLVFLKVVLTFNSLSNGSVNKLRAEVYTNITEVSLKWPKTVCLKDNCHKIMFSESSKCRFKFNLNLQLIFFLQI